VEERSKAISLYSRIVVIKAELQERGYNPNIRVVQVPKKNTGTGKIKVGRRRSSRRGGGVGIYGLGSSPKIWR
jgi:hypothetical protein